MTWDEIESSDARVNTLVYGKYGSGKTYTALTLATVIAGAKGKIAVIDTEGRRTAVFKKVFDFKAFDASHTNDPKEYAAFIEKLTGFDVIVLDSISEAWDGDKGGVLATAAELERDPLEGERKKTVKGQLKWQPAKEGWNKLMGVLRRTDAKVICTAKEKPETDPITKKATGEYAPVMEKNTPYWFDLVLHADNRELTIDKMLGFDNAVGTVITADAKTLKRMYDKALDLSIKDDKAVPAMQ